MQRNEKELYNLIRQTYPKTETLYEYAIIAIIGVDGLNFLKEKSIIETCGMIEDRKLYAI